MKSTGNPVREILVSGHSLGGGMATLAALDLATLYADVAISLYTYGSPRVLIGDTTASGKLDSAYKGESQTIG